jgi:hypothetical protein
MRALRALLLFGCALGLAWLAGWGFAGTELSLPAGMASAGSLLLAAL